MTPVRSVPRLRPGLREPVLDSQRIFRAALEAFSHPGRAIAVPVDIDAPAPLEPSTAAFLLAMADFETPLWLQDAEPAVVEYVRFHCGAPIVEHPREARFALATNPATMPGLDRYDPGAPDYPDRSTTLLIQVPRAGRGLPVTLHGPGIRDAAMLDLGGLKPDFWAQWKRNEALFPCGVDVLFTCGNLFYALPRTTKAEV
jgi:alpha-D-ribose 1-methylphosphonate 5-triphosphate synthase subunit PhnH